MPYICMCVLGPAMDCVAARAGLSHQVCTFSLRAERRILDVASCMRVVGERECSWTTELVRRQVPVHGSVYSSGCCSGRLSVHAGNPRACYSGHSHRTKAWALPSVFLVTLFLVISAPVGWKFYQAKMLQALHKTRKSTTACTAPHAPRPVRPRTPAQQPGTSQLSRRQCCHVFLAGRLPMRVLKRVNL